MVDAVLHLPASFLYKAFSDRSGVPLGFFELYYRGKRLEGEATLASWGVGKDSTIEVKMRGRGGTSNRGKQPQVPDEEPTSSNAHAAETKAAVAGTAAEKPTAAENATAARRVPTALRKAPPRLVSVCDAAGVLGKVGSSEEYQTAIRSFARQQSGHPLTLLGVLTAEDGIELTIDFPRTSFSDLLEMVREAFDELPSALAKSVVRLEDWREKLRDIRTISILMDEVALSGSIVVVGGGGVSLPTDRLSLHIGPIVVSLDDLSALGKNPSGGVPLALPHTTLSSVVELAKRALAAVNGSNDDGFLAKIDEYVNNGPKFVQARAHRRDCAWCG